MYNKKPRPAATPAGLGARVARERFLVRGLDLVLIHPPVTLPCEPPVGMGQLASLLRRRGLEVDLVDENLESLLELVASVPLARAASTAERRALRGRPRALAQLRGPAAYQSLDRYRHAVHDLGAALALASAGSSASVGLANYLEAERSPLSSEDLRAAAREPERSPFLASFRALAERLAERAPRLIGLSLNYLHQALPALALAGVLRARLPRVPILLGGALLGCWRGRLREDAFAPFVDRLVFADGPAALLAALAPGLAPPSPAELLAEPPDYAGLPFASYLAPVRIAPVPTSEGCPWGRCNYCPEALAAARFLPVPAAQVPGLLAATWQRAEAGLLHVCDSAIPEPALAALAAERWDVRWYGFARFYPSLAQPELARGLGRAGCRLLQLGLESASPRVLARLRKGVSPKLASQALHALADAGVAVYLYLMFGTPGETREDALRTLEFVEEHAKLIGFLNTSLLNLPVASAGAEDLELSPLAGGRNDLSLYSAFRHPEGWERRDARRFLEREFSRRGAIAEILRRTPPIFGANHAAFFVEGARSAAAPSASAADVSTKLA